MCAYVVFLFSVPMSLYAFGLAIGLSGTRLPWIKMGKIKDSRHFWFSGKETQLGVVIDISIKNKYAELLLLI